MTRIGHIAKANEYRPGTVTRLRGHRIRMHIAVKRNLLSRSLALDDDIERTELVVAEPLLLGGPIGRWVILVYSSDI